jgi:hypothetical protein
MKRSLFVLLGVLALAGAPALSEAGASAAAEGPAFVSPTAAIHLVSEGEAQVYAAFIEQAFVKGKADGPLAREAVLLENDALDVWQPRRRAWEQYLLRRVGGQGRAADDAHAAFLRRPQQVIRFYSFPGTSLPVRLVRSDILKASMAKGGWNGFYDAYPKVQGVLTFSAVAFGAGGQEALFSARLQCGKRCGYRDLVFMRKVNDAWTLIMKDSLP